MTGTQRRCLAGLAMCVAMLAPSSAMAGPYFGDWTWFWHPSSDCPRGQYSPLHYQAMELYRVRAFVHPSNLDQYPPGPNSCAPSQYNFSNYRCRSQFPTPTLPYATPAAYFGRPVGLPFALP
jgi:hypothetical protein